MYRQPAEGETRTMLSTKLIKILNLDEGATDAQIEEKVVDLRRAVKNDELDELDALKLIERGEHEQVTLNDDGTLTVTLLYPLKSGKEEITEVVVRRPKFKHLREMDKLTGDMAKAQALLAAVSGRATSEFAELDSEDLTVLNACLRFFSEKRRRTGAVS